MARVFTGQDEHARSTVVEDGEPHRSVALESTGLGQHSRSRPSCGTRRTETMDVLVAVSGDTAG